MKVYTVGALARIAGVTVRTLHHYHDIGLLKPAHVGANGYRSYGEDELLRLQQVLIDRELGIPLGEIAAILDGPDFARRYETLAPGFARWLPVAMQAWARRQAA